MLTLITLRDAEYAALSRTELLAVEFLVHESLGEHARQRGSGHAALRLAIRAAGVYDLLVQALGEDGADTHVTQMRQHPTATLALARAAEVARLTDRLSA